MGIPLVIIFGFVLYAFMTWVKWRIMKKKEEKWRMTSQAFEDMMRQADPVKTNAAMDRFKKRMKKEEDEKAEKCFGKTLFDEVEERRNRPKIQSKTGKYTSDMLQDPVSKLYAEMVKNRKNTKEQKEEKVPAK